MTAKEYLQLFYPYFFDSTDPRYVVDADIDKFLLAAEAYRPYCLGEEAQNQAQAHYAAYLMDGVYSSKSPGGVTESVSGPIVRERQGTSEVEYARASDTGPAAATGASTPYARWDAMAAVCRRGAILVGKAFPPVGAR